MILFFAAGASSLAPHILLNESELHFSLERVDLQAKQWSGGDFLAINAKSYVPALQTDDRNILTECGVILQYIADQSHSKVLLPNSGAFARYRALEWLCFIGMEIHKNFITPERHGGVAANFLSKTYDGQMATRQLVTPRLAYVDRVLVSEYLLGTEFSAPDAYLFAMLTWARRLDLDLDPYPNLRKFFDRMKRRPSVQKTLQVEGPPHSLQPVL